MMRSLLQVLLCTLCLASAAHAADPSLDAARKLYKAGAAAYEDGRFEESARLYVEAMQAGAPKVDANYNAACSYALSGHPDEAFAHLQASIDAGLDGQSPADDSDFKSLHGDPRWPQVLARFDGKHPEFKVLDMIKDERIPSATRYFAGRKVVAEGASTSNTNSLFNQYFTFVTQFVGEYDEASRLYGFPGAKGEAVAAGFNRAVDAVPVVLAKAHGRQAVFLNESHGQSQTRAANFALLKGLRADGFEVLAMETLGTTDPVARDASHCSNTTMMDTKLVERGYPISRSGYYTDDPLYAEIVREALRLGFHLVAYDTHLAVNDQAAREQNQADNLACVFKADPKARMVVIAGFSHIAEAKDHWVPGGMMAFRFRQLTGIDPLTVDTTSQGGIDEKSLVFAAHTGSRPVSYALQNAAGEFYGDAKFDLALYVPAPAHRNDGEPSWLELGGLRLRTPVAASQCQGRDPCLVEARHVGESFDAVSSDRCIVSATTPGCTLYLRPGKYEIATFDAAGAELARRPVGVGDKRP